MTGFEFVGWLDPDEDNRPAWNDMEEWQRRHTLLDAYQEKAFLECGEHRWELSIEYGDISIRCLKCLVFYSEVNPDYEENLCYRAVLTSLAYKSDYDSYSGETNDYWLEAE